MRRDWSSYTLVLLLLLTFATYAWMTRQPEAPFFDRAVELPVIGSAISALRSRHLEATPALLGDGAIDRDAGRESLWLGLGSVLRQQPDSESPELERIERLRSYRIVERRSRFIALRLADGSLGWFDPTVPRDMTPPLGTEPDPVFPVPSRVASPELLDAARAILGEPSHQSPLGGYTLLTNVESEALTGTLAAALVGVEKAYRDRYGLSLVGEPAETVILFASKRGYRRFSNEVQGLTGIDSSGHTQGGVVALFAEGRSHEELRRTLLHEIAHLQNRRALGPALPPWLDEGLAQEFAYFSSARLAGEPPSYARLKRFEGNRILFLGALAGLETLRQQLADGTLLSLESLVALDQPSFAHSHESARLYSQSAFWLHSMLRKSPCRSSAEGFCVFLGGIASGAPTDEGTLLQALGSSWPEVELEFRSFLGEEAVRAGLAPSPGD